VARDNIRIPPPALRAKRSNPLLRRKQSDASSLAPREWNGIQGEKTRFSRLKGNKRALVDRGRCGIGRRIVRWPIARGRRHQSFATDIDEAPKLAGLSRASWHRRKWQTRTPVQRRRRRGMATRAGKTDNPAQCGRGFVPSRHGTRLLPTMTWIFLRHQTSNRARTIRCFCPGMLEYGRGSIVKHCLPQPACSRPRLPQSTEPANQGRPFCG